MEFRPFGFSGLAVVLVVVDVGGQSVLKCPECADEGCGEDDDAADEGGDEGET